MRFKLLNDVPKNWKIVFWVLITIWCSVFCFGIKTILTTEKIEIDKQQDFLLKIDPEKTYECSGCENIIGAYDWGIVIYDKDKPLEVELRYCRDCFVRALKWAVKESSEKKGKEK